MKTMKNQIKTCLFIALMLALPAAVHAQFQYSNNGNGTCTITGYTGSGGAVTIPTSTNGLTVTSIGYEAFIYNTSITSITIPNTVTSIGDYAFYYATLNSVNIPNSVTNIGYAANEAATRLPVVRPVRAPCLRTRAAAKVSSSRNASLAASSCASINR